MKRTLLLFLALSFAYGLFAQPRIKDKKYPSLLWEISGKGMKKPSYLIGTMHVSSKIAFHLPDSFYLAIKSAQVVALETNPETWQEDMNKYDFDYGNAYSRIAGRYGNFLSVPSDYLNISTLKYYKYDKQIEKALYSNPTTINSLLYRSYGNESSDFEEDTYLDMYIFQCGKKWGKRVTGVENYGESMRLMVEAYRDAAKDKNKKERSYDAIQEYSADKLQDAYRTGNLDLLDSINKYNSFSDAFDEKFLYRRNEIQAASIDSILKSGSTLFAGVGAAHLPGERGVIEILRRMGYKLRPVKMGERDSHHKDLVDKLRVPVVFHTETSSDGFYKVDIPGKLFKQGSEDPSGYQVFDQRQYADMSNGSYYMVTRILTNAWMWGHATDRVFKTVDSLLYENIPGKILSKTSITKNGYKGFDISNRTRRGDMQRYNIFITPYEIIFFKISGNGDYVKNGDEANRFFNSIQFKEYKNGIESPGWKKFSPFYGGFAVDLPHEPFVSRDGNWLFDAEDKSTNTYYRVIRTDIHNYHFAEEDSFDLGLLNESFMSSEFIDKQLYRKQTKHRGYPALDAKFSDKNGAIYLARFIIQGPHYYTLLAYGPKETAAMKDFQNSFEFRPLMYTDPKTQRDTSLYFSVTTPVFPEEKKIKLDIPRYGFGDDAEEEEESEEELLEAGAYRNRVISNDTTGEKLYVSFYRLPGYHYVADSNDLETNKRVLEDSNWIVRSKKKYYLPNKMRVWEAELSGKGSSRVIRTKVFYKNGIGFSLATQSDTLTAMSPFIKKFFESFTPVDTLSGIDPLVKKSGLFFDDFMSPDSNRHKKAVSAIDYIDLDSTDLSRLKQAIGSLNWKEKKYLDTKESLIGKLKEIKTTHSADYLKELYYALDDTVQVQYHVLETLLGQQTSYAFQVFRSIIKNEPPVISLGGKDVWTDYMNTLSSLRNYSEMNFGNGSFLDELADSLELTKTILPDILPLLDLDDYEQPIMSLLGQFVDSNLIQPSEYQQYYNKFYLEAKQELKKQAIAEKQKSIEKAEESKETLKNLYSYLTEKEKDAGNEGLSLYATLLIPFWETHPTVRPLIGQMLASSDNRLKYNTLLQMIRHDRPYPDSMLSFFAANQDYRYELYTDLKRMGKSKMFPVLYNNHFDLGRSTLLNEDSYDAPDTIAYIDRLTAEVKGRKGFVYFYKYKSNKEDLNWKIAMVGLTPQAPGQFQFDDSIRFAGTDNLPGDDYEFNFTQLTDTKIIEEDPIAPQLEKALKVVIYSRRNSAKEFYEEKELEKGFSSLLD